MQLKKNFDTYVLVLIVINYLELHLITVKSKELIEKINVENYIKSIYGRSVILRISK